MNEFQPGIYPDITEADYHADRLCAEPSLSASLISVLDGRTPAHLQALHPRLSPWPVKDRSSDAQELGAVVHKLVLGRGRDIVVVDGFADWRKAEARDLREEAHAHGKIAVLESKNKQAVEIATQTTKQLKEYFGVWPCGQSEVTLIWQEFYPSGPIWCKARPDHMDLPNGLIVDLKTTELSLSDSEISKNITSCGNDIQAAWYMKGAERLHPEQQGHIRFLFAYAEVHPPYSVRIAAMPEGWLTMARRRCERAALQYSDCLYNNVWPGWKGEAMIECPSWHEQRWMDEELEENS